MAITFPGINTVKPITLPDISDIQSRHSAPSQSQQPVRDNSISLSPGNNPTELILKSAMEKINEMFAPHLPEGTIQNAVDSGLDMSPEATAERIISFATQLIGRIESQQSELPLEDQSSREQLFNNLQVGIERGFEQARGILENMKVLDGEVKETTNATYSFVQQGLSELAILLGLNPAEQTLA